MKNILLLPILILLFVCSCTRQAIDVIPYPNSITYRSGVYDLTKSEVVRAVNIDSITLGIFSK